MLDTLIKNARVADGTGRAIFRGHVGIQGGTIRYIGRDDPGGATRTIDADGLVVSPGFIDPHPHLDAQAQWDRQLTPSCWHGATSAVIGNCGVGLIPARETTREILLRDLVNVEGIDYEVLAAGGVREQQALSLEYAIWKLTAHLAQVFGLPRRGRLAPGYCADIALFDPRTIARARGIVATFIHGVQVMRDGHETGALPGRLIRSTEEQTTV